ncbi:hypothetical protein QQF64_024072 [Cirrhinus molitorella]|uniref:Uncharacterized protein n=1 Tax=Cirrhinus molitorella TaxID=172907 RepID=A0ABR3NKH7_9TELE
MQGYNFKDKLVAQTYDGAAVMASDLNGLQAKVKAIAPSAIEEVRGAFQAVYAKTADLTSDPRDEPMRKRRLTQLQDPQERYRNLYMAILDNILEQILDVFSNLESMLFIELANPEKFDDMRQVFPEEPSKVS